MDSTVIDDMFTRSKDLYDYLMAQGETSHAIEVDNSHKKIMIIACASFFESCIVNSIVEFAEKKSRNKMLPRFIENKALKKQYVNCKCKLDTPW